MKNGRGYNWNQILEEVSKIILSAKSYNTSRIINSLKDFIPEYTPDISFDKTEIKQSAIVKKI